MKPTISRRIPLTPWAVVNAGWFMAWLAKLAFFQWIFQQGFERPIVDTPPFPGFFAHPLTALVAYLAPFLALFLLWPAKAWARATGGLVLCAASLLLVCHAQTYSDMTFVAAFWVGVWITWWASRSVNAEPSEATKLGGRFFGQAVVALCFFGGAVGKMTPEYWSGEAFYHLFFESRPYFPFTALRAAFSQEQLQVGAMLFSRVAVVSEGLMALSVFFPTRLAAWVGLFVLGGMTVATQAQILSVLGSLGFLLLACVMLTREGGRIGRWQLGGSAETAICNKL